MDVGDLTSDTVERALPGRPSRTYPALLSTEAEALAWARSGAPSGALVVAGYQASPRGRAGHEWRLDPGSDLGFSLVLRPSLPARREGWMYVVATSGLADLAGSSAQIEWPDEVRAGGAAPASVGVDVHLGPAGCEWAVVNVLIRRPDRSRAAVLKRAVEAIETRAAESPETVLADYLPRLATRGRSVRARLIPMGPAGVEVTGRALGVRMDGGLVIETEGARRVVVPPQNLGALDQVSGEGDASSSG